MYPLSVVIATLGGDILVGTIELLNQGKTVPAEILICIPEKEASRVETLRQQNVRIIRTPCRGQVAQRAYGLRCVTQSQVLQLDDDIVLRPDDLRLLVQTLNHLGHGHALAPQYRHLSTGSYITEYQQGTLGWMQSLYAFLICGAPWGIRRMGVITPAGIGYGVDQKYCGNELFETQWLSGGCVICHRDDLITEDYYPFTGKAYTEDLVHSVLWRKQGVRLWMLPSATCMTSVASMPFTCSAMKDIVRAHGYVVQLIGGNYWRLRLWHLIYVLKQTGLSAVRMASFRKNTE
jgi:hypothetical protein